MIIDVERKRIMFRKKYVVFIIAICCFIIMIALQFVPDQMLYSIKEDGNHWIVSIKDRNGETVYEDSYEVEPVISEIGKNTIMITAGRGNAWTSRFVNGKMGKVSDSFENVSACNENLVVYAAYKEGEMKIIIRDIYDESKTYKEITDNFPDVAVGSYIIKEAKVINHYLVYIEYYAGSDWKETKKHFYMMI